MGAFSGSEEVAEDMDEMCGVCGREGEVGECCFWFRNGDGHFERSAREVRMERRNEMDVEYLYGENDAQTIWYVQHSAAAYWLILGVAQPKDESVESFLPHGQCAHVRTVLGSPNFERCGQILVECSKRSCISHPRCLTRAVGISG